MTYCILSSFFFPLQQEKMQLKRGKICLFCISESMTLPAVILPNTRKRSLCKQSTKPAPDLQVVKLSLGILFSEGPYMFLITLISILCFGKIPLLLFKKPQKLCLRRLFPQCQHGFGDNTVCCRWCYKTQNLCYIDFITVFPWDILLACLLTIKLIF